MVKHSYHKVIDYSTGIMSRMDVFAFTLIQVVLLSENVRAILIDAPSKCLSPSNFDYIIVGAGAAGGVIANRLSEDPKATVLLLEAGTTPIPASEVPLYALQFFGTDMNWGYKTEPQKHCCSIFINQTNSQNSGRCLGGSSAINGMIVTRGPAADYDEWGRISGDNNNWNFEALLPYFKKLENYQIPERVYDERYHAKGGPIDVYWPTFKTPMADAFLEAGMELGYPQTDNNAEFDYGFTFPPLNINSRGLRWGTYRGYIVPALRRRNIYVVTKAFVTKVIIDDSLTATGVEYELGTTKCTATARKEVVLSAGALQSPKILMLSGVGPRGTLEKFGIPVKQEIAGVGQNMRDHPGFVKLLITLEQPVSFKMSRYNTTRNINLYKKYGIGPLSSANRVEGISFFNSSLATIERPDLEFFYVSDSFWDGYASTLTQEFLARNPITPSRKDIVNIIIALLAPHSTGYVSIRSSNPRDDPIIDPNFLSDERDVTAMIDGVKIAENMAKTKAFLRYGAKLVPYGDVPGCEGKKDGSREYYECIARAFISTAFHPSTTCKMSFDSDPMGVVNSRLKVRGIDKLRVADGSIMPIIPAAHTHFPIIMIGEKASDIIKEDNAI